jgi:hypothetical protein
LTQSGAMLGVGDGRDTVLTRLLHSPRASPCLGLSNVGPVISRRACCPLSLLHRHLLLYPFNSCFSALRKRQSAPCAMIFWGLDLIIPASCRRRA